MTRTPFSPSSRVCMLTESLILLLETIERSTRDTEPPQSALAQAPRPHAAEEEEGMGMIKLRAVPVYASPVRERRYERYPILGYQVTLLVESGPITGEIVLPMPEKPEDGDEYEILIRKVGEK